MLGRLACRPVVTLAGASLVMFCVLLYVGRWQLFWLDEWSFIINRPDPTPRALLAPFFDTFVAVPVLVYDALLATFGMRTYLPFLLVAWAAHFAIVFLLYRIVNRRSGAVLGMAAGLSVVFLGSGWEVLLQPFQIQYLFAIVSGLVALDQLDTVTPTTERGHVVVAAVALVFGVASSGLAVIFTGLLLVMGLLRRHLPTIVAIVPAIAVYAAWYFTWGRESLRVPGPGLGPLESAYAVLYGMGGAVAGLIGLTPTRFALMGLALGLGVVAALVVMIWRGYRPGALALAAIAALVAQNVLQTILRAPYGVEHGARSGYVYADIIFLWLAFSGIVGDRLEAPRWRRRAVPVAAAVMLVPMVLGNMWQLSGVSVLLRHQRATALAELRLIESLRSEPGLALDVQPDDTYLVGLTARGYLAAIDRFGRPTLEWNWETEVDAAAVEAARHRLLPDSP